MCIFDKLFMYTSRKQIVYIWQVIYVKYNETITPTTQIRRMAGASAASEAMLVRISDVRRPIGPLHLTLCTSIIPTSHMKDDPTKS